MEYSGEEEIDLEVVINDLYMLHSIIWRGIARKESENEENIASLYVNEEYDSGNWYEYEQILKREKTIIKNNLFLLPLVLYSSITTKISL